MTKLLVLPNEEGNRFCRVPKCNHFVASIFILRVYIFSSSESFDIWKYGDGRVGSTSLHDQEDYICSRLFLCFLHYNSTVPASLKISFRRVQNGELHQDQHSKIRIKRLALSEGYTISASNTYFLYLELKYEIKIIEKDLFILHFSKGIRCKLCFSFIGFHRIKEMFSRRQNICEK